MKEITSLNQILTTSTSDNLEMIMTELTERSEFSCTGNTCPVHHCRIVGIEDIIQP